MKSVLITGASGSFGRAFTERLLKDGLATRICLYSRGELKQAEMRQALGDDPRLRFMIGDVRDFRRLKWAMHGIDTVIHAAALKRVEVGHDNPIEMMMTNVIGASNVIEAAEECGVQKVVALSTDKAFEPINAYGKSKALAEDLFLAANGHGRTKFVTTRYGNVWASSGSVVPRWKAIPLRERVPVTDPEATRFFMRMEEAVQLVLDATKHSGSIMIPDLAAYRLYDLATAMGRKMEIIGLPDFEKRHESMCDGRSSDKARRMTVEELRAEL
jgi:UDP-N-acetylglucosamine 4,6-dehydratase/5-epimerase